MATAYSAEVAPGGSRWNRIRVKCDYSGTSATITIQFSRTSAYTSRWYDSQASITFNGQTKSAPYDYSGTVGSSWVDIDSASGFTIPTAGGTFNWSFNNPGGGAVLACSGTITLSSQGVAPSNGSITGLSTYWDHGANCACVKASGVSVNDGGLQLTVFNFLGSNEPYTDSGYPNHNRIAVDCVNGLGQVLSYSNNSATDTAGYTMPANSYVYLGIYAQNNAGAYRLKTASGAPTIVTAPPPPYISYNTATYTSIKINYSLPADGGRYSKTFQYSIDGGTTWVNGATASGSSAASGTVTISGLESGTWYTILSRTTTTAGSTEGNSLHLTTTQRSNLYGSASSAATHINKLYGRPGSINWFDKNGARAAYSACTYTVSGEEITLTGNSNNSGYKWYMVVVRGTDALIGKQITVSYDMKTVGSHTSDIRIFWGNSTDTGYSSLVPNTDDAKTTNNQFVHVAKTFTLPDRPSNAGSLLLAFYSNISSAASAVTVFRNVMVKLGTDAAFVPYSGEEATSNYYDSTQVTSYAGITTTGNVAYYILNGTVTSANQRVYTGSTITLPAGTYTFKQEYISGSHSNATPSMWLYVGPNTWTRPFTDSCYVSASRPTFTKTFTLSEPASLRLALYTRANETYTNYKARISIVAGSTAGDFEPYIGMPGARAVCKLYGSVNGVAKLIFARHTQE